MRTISRKSLRFLPISSLRGALSQPVTSTVHFMCSELDLSIDSPFFSVFLRIFAFQPIGFVGPR
jgi:hypothetical protein